MQKRWSIFEKERFSTYNTFVKMEHLFISELDIRGFTDHRNLLFVFNPTSLQPSLGRHVVRKVENWAIYLSQFPYMIDHVRGEANVMADIIRQARQSIELTNAAQDPINGAKTEP